MLTAAQAVQTAQHLIGLGEYPDGSNHNEVTEWYGEGDIEWCAVFVAYVLEHPVAGDAFNLRGALGGGDIASTITLMDEGKAKGWWHDGTAGLEAGDIVLYKIPGGDAGPVNHTGFALGAEANGTVASIDGNWGNHVVTVHHPADQVVGYVRPPYSPEPHPSGTYTVQSGDTLSGIAAHHGTTAASLYAANKGVIESTARAHGFFDSHQGSRIWPGTVLTLTTAPAGGGGTYTVRSGDTLSEIAASHGTTAEAVYVKNSDVIEHQARMHGFSSSENGSRIWPGTVLAL
jgi:LysM repeat protein